MAWRFGLFLNNLNSWLMEEDTVVSRLCPAKHMEGIKAFRASKQPSIKGRSQLACEIIALKLVYEKRTPVEKGNIRKSVQHVAIRAGSVNSQSLSPRRLLLLLSSSGRLAA